MKKQTHPLFGWPESTFSAVFHLWVNYSFNTSITATSYVHSYLILSICWANKWLLCGTTIIRKCDVNHRNVPDCVKCCRNTNSEVKVTCLAYTRHQHIFIWTTPNISCYLFGTLELEMVGTGWTSCWKCWRRLQHARKQYVPWWRSPGNPAL